MCRIKYISVYFDANLNWKSHTSNVFTKISLGFGIIRYSYNFLPNFVSKILYHTFVYPYLIYFIECWGNAAKVFVNPILIKQKRALRLIGCYYHIEYNNFVAYMSKLLLLPECFELYVCLLMYSVYNYRCPSNICTLFTKPIHGHNTKQADNNFCVPHRRTAAYRNSVC